jgi:integrase
MPKPNDATSTESSIISTSYASAELVKALAEETKEATRLQGESLATNTKRAYASDWRGFESWCASKGLSANEATPAVMALYLAALNLRAKSFTTIVRAYYSIAKRLRETAPEAWPIGIYPPAIKRTLENIHRERPGGPTQKAPLTPEVLARLSTLDLGPHLKGERNRALLLVGFAGAFRRSELVGINVCDVHEAADGMTIHIPKSKTDQLGAGYTKALKCVCALVPPERCPVEALKRWIRVAYLSGFPFEERGPVFRRVADDGARVGAKRMHPEAVAQLVKRVVAQLGLDPALYAGHSLRAGFVTSASLQGATLDEIMHQTAHKSVTQVRSYMRRATPFQGNVSDIAMLTEEERKKYC